MFKTKDLSTTGTVNLSHAYGVASAQPDAGRRRASLRPLKKQLEGALGIDDLATAKQVQIFEIRTRLRAYLLSQGLSKEHARNQNSTLNFVLRHATILDGSQDFGDWGSVIDLAITAIRERTPQAKVITNLSRAQKYMISFFVRSEITRASFTSEIHLKAYRKFLAEDCRLNPEGNGRLVLNASKHILSEIGIALEMPTKLATLPELFRMEIEIMGKHATQRQAEPTAKKIVDDPFADTPGDEDGKIRQNTWGARKGDLERYLRYWQSKELKKFEQSQLCDWLNVPRLKDYLRIGYQEKRFTASTAETYVSRFARFISYANATQTGGFHFTEEELKSEVSAFWSLIGKIRKNFGESRVNERLKVKGGVPDWAELHREFEKNLIRECKEIERYQKKSKVLKSKPETRELGQVTDLRIALRLSAVIQASFHLYGACRPNDPRETIKTDSLTRVSPEYYSLNYLPSKTSGKTKPSVVDMCLPIWMTPLIETYLSNYQPLIYEGADLLFPADQRLKRVHASVAHEGPARRGNSYAAVGRMTRKFFGKSINANTLRYSLTAFYSVNEIGGLYLHLGHRPDRTMNKLTDIENTIYHRKHDHERIKIANRQYEPVIELLQDREKLMAAVKKVLG